MRRSDPWNEPPRTAAWRRLIHVVVPVALAAGCDETGYTGTVGCETNGTCDSSEYTGTMAVPDSADTSDTGAP